MENYIIERGDWVALSDIPSSRTKLSEAFWADSITPSGVYQVALGSDIDKIGNDLIHESIGYTGQTGNFPLRVYSLRTNSHNCGKYVKSMGWKLSDVFVRVLHTEAEDSSTLEKAIFAESDSKFGKRFAWKAASAGSDGKVTQIEHIISTCSIEELTELHLLTKSRLETLLLEKHLEDLS